ncbi:putative membrane protein [Halarchaeum solikamskense]|uniref:bisanhydrobacterioruberin hydratase n=1 Tax=Halarchaeum nitratireducens TaxID=489913 RepID=UPI001B3AC13E|nr:putative membrane protein [Halarchaeum solikamskense]
MDSATLSALSTRLDRLVAANRPGIAVLAPLIGAASLIGGALGYVPRWLAFNAVLLLLGTAMLRLPLVAAVLPEIDRRALAALGALCGYTYLIEYVGVTSGWPYGAFSYGVELGPMVAGVPLALPLFFLPLVCNAYFLAVLLLGERAGTARYRLPATVAIVLLVDCVLDPGAVALGFWSYADGGVYYGVPLSNYAGWVLSGSVAVLALDVAFDHRALRARLDDCPFALDDLVSFVVLWGLVNLVYANWLPVLCTAALVCGLLATDRFDLAFARGSGGVDG